MTHSGRRSWMREGEGGKRVCGRMSIHLFNRAADGEARHVFVNVFFLVGRDLHPRLGSVPPSGSRISPLTFTCCGICYPTNRPCSQIGQLPGENASRTSAIHCLNEDDDSSHQRPILPRCTCPGHHSLEFRIVEYPSAACASVNVHAVSLHVSGGCCELVVSRG